MASILAALALAVAIGSLGGVERASAAGDPVVAAAGDIACSPFDARFGGGLGTSSSCRQRATSDLLTPDLAAVLPLGDLQYECASPVELRGAWTPSWGRFDSITRPAIGNHEYYTSGGSKCDKKGRAAGYFNYFGAAAGDPSRGYYSYNVGAWHLVALNSNCAKVGGCGYDSPQARWLRADLSANPRACTLAYWHHPKYSSKSPSSSTNGFWTSLYAAGADVVLNGHVHHYERFAPQDANGLFAPGRGIRQFIVGTGGKSLENHGLTPAPNSEARGRAFGILKITLHPTSYDWQFAYAGSGTPYIDSGSSACSSN